MVDLKIVKEMEKDISKKQVKSQNQMIKNINTDLLKNFMEIGIMISQRLEQIIATDFVMYRDNYERNLVHC